MAQTIRYMSKAAGVIPAPNHNAGTPQPFMGSKPAYDIQQAGVPIFLHSTITLAAATDPLAAGDIYVAAPVLPGYELVDATIVAGDIDNGAALTLTLAQLLPDFTDIVAGTEVMIASTVGQNGGVARAANAPGLLLGGNTGPTADTRWYGVKIANAPAGLNAGAQLRVILIYEAAEAGW